MQFYADNPNNPSQCRGATGQQWAAAPGWSSPILIDTDQRNQGCQLAFGVYDGDGSVAGLSLSYTWQASHGGNGATQCGNQGTHQAPVNQFRAFGPLLGADTDQREGWCNLTFSVSGRSDVVVDVQWFPEFENNGQCQGYVPQGQYRTAYPNGPLTIGVDTDSRNGGCWLSLRLRQA
ncbi:hypothetical protein [Streptomyces sp. B6B3]|uniref:hypothetical protein n=1 Tax=Streptomyces sp. B6B3 TaxID=3153570 RepID=UPI00325CCB0B